MIFVIDPSAEVRDAIALRLRNDGLAVETFAALDAALLRGKQRAPELLISADETPELFAMPLDLARISSAVANALEEQSAKAEPAAIAAETTDLEPEERIVGDCEAIRRLRAQVQMLAKLGHDAPITLITGETGVGKSFVAKAIHIARFGADAPWIEVSCAALPGTLFEAELFGYERSAFTDAKTAKPGLFEAAVGGTLFLDEIGEMPLELQAKLLRVVESRRVRRLGALKEREVAVSLVCATNVDLPAAVREGKFRADLYHRLAAYTVAIPPLRARGGDILTLARRFLESSAARYKKNARGFSKRAEAQIASASWPGNVRELSFAVERAVLAMRDEDTMVSTTDLFPAALIELEPSVPPPIAEARRGARLDAADPKQIEVRLPEGGVSFAELERAILSEALRQTGGNVVRAAKLLSIKRDAMRYRMRRLGLVQDRVGEDGPNELELDELDTVDIDAAG